MEQVTGTVDCWFNGEKGYGFIRPEGGDEAIFVHYTGITVGSEEGYLSQGDRVIYELVRKERGGLWAEGVCKAD